MGRVAIRGAIQAQIQGLSIPYVGTVYPARPVIAEEEAYTQTMNGQAVASSAAGSNCIIVVNMPSDHRVRRALTGRPAVNDTNNHKIALELFFASTGGDGVQAQYDYDSIIDALVTGIRYNATPGGSSVVWSAGEMNAGVDHTQTQPYTTEDGLTILINGAVKYEAWEWIAGTDV